MNNGIVWLITIIDRSSIDKSSFNLSLIKPVITNTCIKASLGHVTRDIGTVTISLASDSVCRIRTW